MKDYYQILGIASDADETTVKKAYRDLAKRYHPDKNPGNKNAEEMFKQIGEAYDTLSDKQKRARYDRMRSGDFSGEPSYSDGNFAQQNSGFDFSSIFGSRGFDFGDILGDLFGFGRTQSKNESSANASSVRIPLAMAFAGGHITIELQGKASCRECDGTGGARGAKMQRCEKCDGSGRISTGMGSFGISRTCPNCLGRGQVFAKKCEKCAGTGYDTSPRRVSVKILPGTTDGTTLRLRKLGANGGDLLLSIIIEPQGIYWLDGKQLYATIFVSPEKLANGAKLTLTTLDNRKLKIAVPPNTADGAKLRIRGHGFYEKPDTRGDLIIVLAQQ